MNRFFFVGALLWLCRARHCRPSRRSNQCCINQWQFCRSSYNQATTTYSSLYTLLLFIAPRPESLNYEIEKATSEMDQSTWFFFEIKKIEKIYLFFTFTICKNYKDTENQSSRQLVELAGLKKNMLWRHNSCSRDQILIKCQNRCELIFLWIYPLEFIKAR